jgi:hypothetical protein
MVVVIILPIIGSLRYVRIEFAGIALQPDKEINGLTLCAVGSGTTIDHVQVSYSGEMILLNGLVAR